MGGDGGSGRDNLERRREGLGGRGVDVRVGWEGGCKRREVGVGA